MSSLQCHRNACAFTEARRMMLDEATVTDASLEVGYESVSQFIRDYRKCSGYRLKEDI